MKNIDYFGNKSSISKILLLLFIFLVINPISAQTSSIYGRVIDSSTQEPLAYVNIFITNTTLGTATDLDGTFTIINIPHGIHQVCASYIGYKIYRQSIHMEADSSYFIDIPLKQILIGVDTVKVIRKKHAYQDAIDLGRLIIGIKEISIAPSIGEPDIFRVLEMHPGITTTNDFNIGLHIRGGNCDQNLILLDGMPVYNPYHLAGIFSTFDTDGIQWINLYKSGIAPRYGNRLSSVIDVNMRDGTAQKHEGHTNISLLSTKIRMEGPHKLGTYMFTLRRTYADLFINGLNKIGLLPEEIVFPYHFVDGMGKVVIKPSVRHRIELTSYIGQDKYNLAVLDDDPGSGVYTWHNDAVGVKYTSLISSQLAFHAQCSGSIFSATWLPPDTTNKEKIENVFSGVMIKSFFTANNKIFGCLSSGYEFQRNKFFLETKGFSYQPIIVEENKTDEVSLYFDLSKSFKDKLNLNYGLRATRFSSQDTIVLSPQISTNININKLLSIHAHWGRYHQGLMSIGTEEPILSMFDAWISIPRNRPVMSATHRIVNIQYQLHQFFEISLAIFNKRYDRLVEFNTKKFSCLDSDFVEGSGHSIGIELLIKKRNGKFNGWLAYTYSKTKKSVQGTIYPPKYDKPQDLNIVFQYRLSKKWAFGSRFIYQSGTPFTKVIGYYRQHNTIVDVPGYVYHTEVPVYSAKNAFRLPPYHRLDLTVHKKFIWREHDMEWYVDLANIYARLNVLAYSEENEAWIQVPPLITFGIKGQLW